MHLPGSALESGAVFECECQAAIRVGRGVVQQAAPELFAEGGDLAVLLFQDSEDLKYYYAYFNSRRKDIVRRLARATNKKAINDTRLKSYRISFPNIIEQDKIGDEVQTAFDNIERLKKQIAEEYQKIGTLV